MAALEDLPWVLDRLRWMREERIWPTGKRYLWTDGFGVVLLVSLYHWTGEEKFLAAAEEVVAAVERVLGRRRGIRIGEAADRDGQYFHYLATWMYALYRLGLVKPEYRQRGIDLVRQVHPAFVIPGTGVWWKMEEDLPVLIPAMASARSTPSRGDRVERLNAFFDTYRSGDEYDTEAITHVMGCTSHFPGEFLPVSRV